MMGENMSENIKRINSYFDNRFDDEVLRQHGAFIVDDQYKCAFRVVGKDKAIIEYDEGIDLEKVIDEFRFYTEHITKFYNTDMILVKTFEPIKSFRIQLKDIQPSQFLVNQEKVAAIKTFISSGDDIYVPLVKFGENFVSCDGHTRLYYASQMNFPYVNGFISDSGDYLEAFAEEAKARQVYTPGDLKQVKAEDYEIKWNQFCDDFFKARSSK